MGTCSIHWYQILRCGQSWIRRIRLKNFIRFEAKWRESGSFPHDIRLFRIFCLSRLNASFTYIRFKIFASKYSLRSISHCLLPAVSVHCLLARAYCPLPTAHCSLPTVYWLGPIVHWLCPLPAVYCPLFTAHCLLPSSYCLLSTCHCLLPTVYCPLPLCIAHCLRASAYCPLPPAHSPLPTVYCLLSTPTVHCPVPDVRCPLSLPIGWLTGSVSSECKSKLFLTSSRLAKN